MGRRASLNHQFYERMEKLNCIGQSRHQAKKEAAAAGLERVTGIHSNSTYSAYKDTARQLATFLSSKGIKHIESVDKYHLVGFLNWKQSQGLKPASLDRHLAAVNKIFNTHITKKEAGIPSTKYKDITRSRGVKAHDAAADPGRWKNQIAFAAGAGLRRHEIKGGQYQVKAASVTEQGGRLYVSTIGKGGRYRVAPVLSEHQETIRQIIQDAGGTIAQRGPMTAKEYIDAYRQDQGGPLFSNYSTKIDNHAYRREYAQQLYQGITQDLEPAKDYKGYDLAACLEVSEALGHSRPDVTVYHYLK